MRITKMHGAGNDFVIVNNLTAQIPPERFPLLSKKLCAPHTGVGADGMMVVVPAEKDGDFGMRFYNKNGARCICRWGYEHGLAGQTQRVETTAGLVSGERVDARRYRVRLNDPSVIDLHRRLQIDGEDYDCAYVELGDPGIPHAVIQLPEWDTWDTDRLRALGRKLRYAPVFPRGANVSFVKASGTDAVKAVTYERGVEDFTLACGTGCGSIAAALTLLLLSVTLSNDVGIRDIFLSGPTCLVFEGEVSEELLEEA